MGFWVGEGYDFLVDEYMKTTRSRRLTLKKGNRDVDIYTGLVLDVVGCGQVASSVLYKDVKKGHMLAWDFAQPFRQTSGEFAESLLVYTTDEVEHGVPHPSKFLLPPQLTQGPVFDWCEFIINGTLIPHI